MIAVAIAVLSLSNRVFPSRECSPNEIRCCNSIENAVGRVRTVRRGKNSLHTLFCVK